MFVKTFSQRLVKLFLCSFLLFHSFHIVAANDEKDVVQPLPVLWVSVISDVLIALAYFAIPIEIWYFIKKYQFQVSDVIYVLGLFILFIFFCGITHAVNIYSFFSDSWVALCVFKVLTAIVSVVTAITLVSIIPKMVTHLKELENKRFLSARRMLAYVNHELRNPLQTILGLVQCTQLYIKDIKMEESDKEEVENYLKTAMASGRLMNHIMNDVLDIQKLENKKVEILSEPIDVDEFIQLFMETIEPKISEENIDFQINMDPNIQITSDRYRLNQIMLNFTSNAFKYTKFLVKLVIRKHKKHCFFAVLDNGPGIATKKIVHIFQPFDATDSNDASRHGGVGLGLYLCKMLADLLKGKIGFRTIKNIGTIMYIAIPLKEFIQESVNFDSFALQILHKNLSLSNEKQPELGQELREIKIV